MHLSRVFYPLFCIPYVLAEAECTFQSGRLTYGSQSGPPPPPPEFSKADGHCSLHKGGIGTNYCGATTIETQPVDDTVKDTWIEACNEYIAKSEVAGITVEFYAEETWNSLWNYTMDGGSGAGCSFQFKIATLPKSGPVSIGGQDIADLQHDMPQWAMAANNQSVGGTMGCQSDSQITWRMIPGHH